MVCCKQCQTEFKIAEEDFEFYKRVSPVFGEAKCDVPPPTRCPDCRQQRRLALNNEMYLYPGTCNLCNKRTMTEHPPHAAQPIYCRECWHSDAWDPRDYGRDFDFSQPFFDQLKELKRTCPAQALSIQGTNENSEYIHLAGFSKNSYLIMHADECENCYYGYGFKHVKNCVDGFYNIRSELCYDCVDVSKCYDLIGCQDCVNCSSSAFLRDCIGCLSCFLCTGLRNKQYCFENQQLTKDQYIARMQEVHTGSYDEYQQYKQKRRKLEQAHTFKDVMGHNYHESSGFQLYNCKNVQDSFDIDDVEEGKYLYQIVIGAKDVYDTYQYGNNLQQSYENSICGLNSYNLLFCHETHTCIDVIYGWYMEDCKHCFGCANMHHKEYCILNKQYSKEEYDQLVPKIIDHMQETGEWGEFLPLTHILHGYNRTTAQLYYPLTKKEATDQHIPWDDYENPPPDNTRVIDANRLPDTIDEIPDDILNWAISCTATGKLFKITSHELTFYRQQRIPIPRTCWEQRHIARFAQRNPRHLWDRTCAKCSKDIRTSYSPNRPEIVYCEECYLAEVY